MLPLSLKLYHKSSKMTIFDIFQKQTLELGETIRKETKTRLYQRACLFQSAYAKATVDTTSPMLLALCGLPHEAS